MRRNLERSQDFVIADKNIRFSERVVLFLKKTVFAVKWGFLLILLYLMLGLFVSVIYHGMQTYRDLMIYGVQGFFTFFMGYFGWMMAIKGLEIIDGRKRKYVGPHESL
ncbi:MAG: hypothetical protein V1726_03460 [Methanobacteriota archaeon]